MKIRHQLGKVRCNNAAGFTAVGVCGITNLRKKYIASTFFSLFSEKKIIVVGRCVKIARDFLLCGNEYNSKTRRTADMKIWFPPYGEIKQKQKCCPYKYPIQAKQIS